MAVVASSEIEPSYSTTPTPTTWNAFLDVYILHIYSTLLNPVTLADTASAVQNIMVVELILLINPESIRSSLDKVKVEGEDFLLEVSDLP